MQASTVAILVGIVIFALPIPGTFITGALVIVAGLAAKILGS